MKGERPGRGGPGGNCICLKCGTKVPHQAGTPCMDTKCPQCGATMIREGSEHHRLFQEKKNSRQK
jgi:ribosomal protein L40E